MTTNIGYEFPDTSGEIASLRRQLALKDKALTDLRKQVEKWLEDNSDKIYKLEQQLAECREWREKAFMAHPNIDMDIEFTEDPK
jgi:hypothetical protein